MLRTQNLPLEDKTEKNVLKFSKTFSASGLNFASATILSMNLNVSNFIPMAAYDNVTNEGYAVCKSKEALYIMF